jgi:nucleoside-diphosphate-sugar epimerase
MQLALKLHEDCGVEVIGGVDLMYPNTVAHRLALVQERLALLTARIPQLHKPVGLSYMGILPSSSNKHGGHEQDDDYEILESLQPTHVIHLASYTPHQYPTVVVPDQDPQGVGGSPYYGTASWFARQSAWWGMEQLLQGLQDIAHRPQFVYVTTTNATKPVTTTTATSSILSSDPVWQTIQTMEQVLVRTYQQEPALSIQLPQLYGEWDLPGSIVHDTMEHVVAQHARGHQPPTKELPLSSSSTTTLSLLHIDDALDAIVAALQYQPSRSTMTMDLSRAASPQVSTNHLVTFLESQLLNAPGTTPEAAAEAEAAILTHRDDGSVVVQPSHPALIGWQPRISLHQGLIRTMAWHLHRQNPYGNSGSQTKVVQVPSTTTNKVAMEHADDFLIRHGQLPCEANDWNCHKSWHSPVPCLSECNSRQHCLPSIFDGIEVLTRNVTEGCQIVLYTQALGYNIKDLALQSEYMDDVDLHENEKLVCNFAFVPRDSTLVEMVTGKVPNEQLTKFGIVPQIEKDLHDLKLDGLNGRLLYRGWILLWVNDATKPLSPTDQSLLKLSPSKFFHSDVERALFMEDNFSVSPTLADIFFLVDQLKRRALPKRTVKKDVRAKTSFGKETVKRQKFRLPPEPPRRAAILFAPLRLPNDAHDSNIQRIRRGEKKLKLRDAVKLMRYEWDLEGKETESEALQRDFYEKIPSYLNRNDLRNHQEPWYQYSMRHWVRTRWVVHDLQLEEARHLRCDWYQEHLAWGNELDQLSFAHVMAVRELKRRIAHQEPDDHVKTFIEQHPQLRDLTDSYEWHPMETDINLLYREPVQWNAILPDHLEVEGEEESPEVDPNEPLPLFVRIISEHVMASSRRLWANEQKKKEKTKHKQ